MNIVKPNKGVAFPAFTTQQKRGKTGWLAVVDVDAYLCYGENIYPTEEAHPVFSLLRHITPTAIAIAIIIANKISISISIQIWHYYPCELVELRMELKQNALENFPCWVGFRIGWA